MSDNYNDDADENFEDDSIPGLRRAASKAKKLDSENRNLKRELAFAKAGLPLDDPKMSYFIKGYDGELTAEAIKDAALDAGFLQQSIQQSQPVASTASLEGQSRVMAASAGATSEDMSEEAALARMEQAMAEGGMSGLLDVVRQYGIPIASEM